MADNKVQQIIEILTRGAKKSEKEVKGVSNGLKNLAKQAAVAAGAYFGARALLGGIKASIDLFAQQELAEKKLRFAAGASTDQLIKQAKALQSVTIFGDEAIKISEKHSMENNNNNVAVKNKRGLFLYLPFQAPHTPTQAVLRVMLI